MGCANFQSLLDERMRFAHERDLRTVPVEAIVEGGAAERFEHTLERWLSLATGVYAGTKNRKEGVVVRPLVGRRSETLGGRLSFKVISNEFLLKDEE